MAVHQVRVFWCRECKEFWHDSIVLAPGSTGALDNMHIRASFGGERKCARCGKGRRAWWSEVHPGVPNTNTHRTRVLAIESSLGWIKARIEWDPAHLEPDVNECVESACHSLHDAVSRVSEYGKVEG